MWSSSMTASTRAWQNNGGWFRHAVQIATNNLLNDLRHQSILRPLATFLYGLLFESGHVERHASVSFLGLAAVINSHRLLPVL